MIGILATLKKRKASARVYVPNQWENVIASCRQSNPFQIQHMTSDLFFDFGDLEKQFTRRKKDASKKDVLISKVTWMNFGQASINRSGREIVEKHPNEVWLRYTYISAEPWSKVSLLKGRKKTQPDVSLDMPELYPNGHGVKPKKVADLQKMLPYMSKEHCSF